MKPYMWVIVILVIILAAFLYAPRPAKAEGLTDGAFLNDISESVFTGATKDGETIIRSESIFKNSNPEFLWGIPLDYVKVDVIQIGNLDGTESNFVFENATIAGSLGESDNFYLSIIRNDTYGAWGTGIIYDPSHWIKAEKANPDMRVGVYMLESGYGLITFDGRYEFPKAGVGYGLFASGQLGMEDWGNRDYLDGRVGMWHNLNPSGNLWLEAGVENRIGENYIYAGVGMTIF